MQINFLKHGQSSKLMTFSSSLFSLIIIFFLTSKNVLAFLPYLIFVPLALTFIAYIISNSLYKKKKIDQKEYSFIPKYVFILNLFLYSLELGFHIFYNARSQINFFTSGMLGAKIVYIISTYSLQIFIILFLAAIILWFYQILQGVPKSEK